MGCSAESLRRIRAHGLTPCNCRNFDRPSTVVGAIEDLHRGIGDTADAATSPAVLLGGITGIARGLSDAGRAIGALPAALTGSMGGIPGVVTQRGISVSSRLIAVARRPPQIPQGIPTSVMGVPLRSVIDALDNWRRLQAEQNCAQMMIGVWDAVSCCVSQRDDLGKLALIAWGGSFVSTTVLLPYFAAGCLYGEYLDLRSNAELLRLIPDALSGELGESIAEAAKTATQLLLTKAGGPLAYKIGYSVACDEAREIIHLLNDEWYLIPFRLGQFTGPFIVDALLSALGIGALLGISTITSRIRRLGSAMFEVTVDILDAGISPQAKRAVIGAVEAAHETAHGRSGVRRAIPDSPDVNLGTRPEPHGTSPSAATQPTESPRNPSMPRAVTPRDNLLRRISADGELMRFLGPFGSSSLLREPAIEAAARASLRAWRRGGRARAGAINRFKGLLQERLFRALPWHELHLGAARRKLQRLPSSLNLNLDTLRFVAGITCNGRPLSDGMIVALSADESMLIILDILEAKSGSNWRRLYGEEGQFQRDLIRLRNRGNTFRFTLGDSANPRTLTLSQPQVRLLSDFGEAQPLTASIPREFNSSSYGTLQERLRALASSPGLPVRIATPVVHEGALPNELAERLARIILEEIESAR